MPRQTAFDRDFDRWMRDPEFAESYTRARERIDRIDSIVRLLDEARQELGLTKAAVARQIGAPAPSVRRFFTHANRNPSLGFTLEIASAVGVDLFHPARSRAAVGSRRSAARRQGVSSQTPTRRSQALAAAG